MTAFNRLRSIFASVHAAFQAGDLAKYQETRHDPVRDLPAAR
jgi:hypothetical protein